MSGFWWFIIGLFVGGGLSFALLCCLQVGHDAADRSADRTEK